MAFERILCTLIMVLFVEDEAGIFRLFRVDGACTIGDQDLEYFLPLYPLSFVPTGIREDYCRLSYGDMM